jgi:dephospho-CoA kinase
MVGRIRLGLTGGIGSGKSTVARIFQQHGAAIVDADAVARSVTQSGGLAIEPIRAAFGADLIDADGALDREKMRGIVYADPRVRERLEAIIHPLVGQETMRQAQAAASAGHRLIVFDIPLLVESKNWRSRLDHIVVVDCTAAVQIGRVMARSGLSALEVERIIAAQARRETRLCAADTVICNSHLSLLALEGLVAQIAHRFGLSSAQPLD